MLSQLIIAKGDPKYSSLLIHPLVVSTYKLEESRSLRMSRHHCCNCSHDADKLFSPDIVLRTLKLALG